MDALKHKVHTAYKVREPNPRSLHPNEPSSPLPPARAPPSSPFLFKRGCPIRTCTLLTRAPLPPPRLLQGVAESLMTTRTTSAFLEKGVVTPEEFVLAGEGPKGAIEEVARTAGILAAKRTGELIPMCHQLLLNRQPRTLHGVEGRLDHRQSTTQWPR